MVLDRSEDISPELQSWLDFMATEPNAFIKSGWVEGKPQLEEGAIVTMAALHSEAAEQLTINKDKPVRLNWWRNGEHIPPEGFTHRNYKVCRVINGVLQAKDCRLY